MTAISLSWRARMRWRARRVARGLAWIAIGTCVLGSLSWLGWLLQATHARSAALAAATAGGMSTDFGTLMGRAVPDERNAALVLERAYLLMISPASRLADGHLLPAAQALSDLTAPAATPVEHLPGVAADDHPRPDEHSRLLARILALSNEQCHALLADVTHSPWWPLLAQAADLPDCRFAPPGEGENPLEIQLPHLMWIRVELQMVRRVALLSAAVGDGDGAWRNLRLADRLVGACLRDGMCVSYFSWFGSELLANRQLALDLRLLGGTAASAALETYLATDLPPLATSDDWQRVVRASLALWVTGMSAFETQGGDRILIDPPATVLTHPLRWILAVHPLVGRPYFRQETARLINDFLAMQAREPAALPLKQSVDHGFVSIAELEAISFANLRQRALFADLAFACLRQQRLHGTWPASVAEIDPRFRPVEVPSCDFLVGPGGLRLKREEALHLSPQVIRLYSAMPAPSSEQ